jgi:probable F420-dependent oxidoreductase
MVAPMATLAFVAGVTTRIRLGTGVYLLPMRHPTIAAKDIASVDVLSGGRVIVGVGAGGENPAEYEALSTPLVHRGRQMEEAILALRTQFERPGEAFEGEFHSFPAFSQEPRPIQEPMPIWLGGRAEAVVARAARVAQGWFPVWVSARRIREARDQLAQLGAPDDFRVALNVFTAPAADRATGRSNVANHLRSAYGLDFDSFERYAAYGTAEQIAGTLAEYVEAGVTDIAFNLAGPAPAEQVQQLAEEVVPLLQQ